MPEDMIFFGRLQLMWLLRIAAALALAGCGAGASAATTGSVPINFPNLGYRYIPPHLPPGVSAGTALVVDLTNVGRVAPQDMQLASDTWLSGAHWSGWGAASTTAHGSVTIHVCNPNCGGGYHSRYKATVVLSHLVRCVSHRFYETGSVTIDTVDGPKPWGAVLKNPCP